ncbi:MAG: DNA repair protein RadC [Kiritimatiellia bacterium]|jgi:DNA repair protein RadC|nr:DNA repair protein RadC [Kiritimatiellia bacterium]
MERHPCPSDRRTAYPDAAPPIRDLPVEMRPREELQRRGAENLPDELLLAILLRSGLPGKNVTELAREILFRYGGLAALSKTTFEELLHNRIKGLGKVKALELSAALELGRRAAQQGPRHDTPVIRDPEAAYRVLLPLTRALQQEIFWTLLLDTKSRLIGQPVETSRGLLDSSPVHPREVFNKAVRYSAASMILAHNHPSGDPVPSKEDIEITRRLVEAARILGIRVVDHLIVGKPSAASPGYVSLRERNLVAFE